MDTEEEVDIVEDEQEEVERDWKECDRKPPSLWRRFKWKADAAWSAIASIPSFFVRVWHYRKLLWRDRDWDWIFLLEMMQFKIKRMREHMVEHNILLHTNMHAKQMKYAEFLLERIITNDYCREEYEALEKKWGRLKMMTAPCEDHPGSSYLDFTRANCLTKEEKVKEREESMALHYKQDATREKDLDRLFRHIRNYIQRWWD